MVKAVVERVEAAWKVLGARDEVAKERCMKPYREEKRKVKSIYITSKRG